MKCLLLSIVLTLALLTGCSTTPSGSVTAPTRARIADASTAATNATAATQRASGHAAAIDKHLDRLDYKGIRALQILDGKGRS